jgi:hypothetical protein
MVKHERPEILEAPMSELSAELFYKIAALAEHYGGEKRNDGSTNWEAVAINLAMQYVPGFQVGPPPKKRGRQPDPATAARDFYIAYLMNQEINRHLDRKNEEAAANAVYKAHTILGATEEPILGRWKVLKRCGGAFERMKEYAMRVHDWPK